MFKPKFIAQTLAAASLLAMTAVAHAQTADRVYVIDQRNEVAKSGTGLCWRTGFWTPAAAANDPAGCGCDKDLLPKEKCEPPKPAPAPAPAPAPKKCDFTATLKDDQTFDYNKATLKKSAMAYLDKEVVSKLSSCASVKMVLVTGHTDRLGSATYNQTLSQKRADAVKAYLVKQGVSAASIETMGAGKTQPATGVAKCDDKLPKKKLIECLAPHRRTVVEVQGPAK